MLRALIVIALCVAGNSVWAEEVPSGLLQGFSAASQKSEELLRGASMEIDIEARVPKLNESARLHGLRKVSRFGKVTFDKLRLTGDTSVKHEIIARYLTAESTDDAERPAASLALTPANYRFKYKGRQSADGTLVDVFQLTPRHKQQGSFQGELWIDAATFLPVHESGRVLQHSLFLKNINVTREFHGAGGIAVPDHTLVTIDTRGVGKAEMSVDFKNLTLDNASTGLNSGIIADEPAVQ